MLKFVVGFLFNETGERVALIKKNRPQWQAGLLTGIGGKIEEGETPEAAMDREFLEETGLDVKTWIRYAVLKGDDYEVYVFYTSDDAVSTVLTMSEFNLALFGWIADEVVDVYDISHLNELPALPSIRWLIPMALSFSYEKKFFTINEE